MHPTFIFQDSIDIFTSYFYCNISITSMIVVIGMYHFHPPAFLLRQSAIHAIKHSGEIFGIVATSAGENSHNGVASIIFSYARKFIFELLQFLYHGLGFLGIIPEIRSLHSAFYFFYSLLFFFIIHIEPLSGIEPETSILPISCSTN